MLHNSAWTKDCTLWKLTSALVLPQVPKLGIQESSRKLWGKGTIHGLRLRDSRDSRTPKTLGLPRLRDSQNSDTSRLPNSICIFGIHFCFSLYCYQDMFWKVMKFIFQISLLGWTIQFHYLICIWMPACESISFMAYQSSSLVSHHPGAWGVGPPPRQD